MSEVNIPKEEIEKLKENFIVTLDKDGNIVNLQLKKPVNY